MPVVAVGRLIGASVVLPVLGLMLLVAPTALGSEFGSAPWCEETEAAVRLSLVESGWTEQLIDETAREEAAECWAAVHAQEEEAAKEAAQAKAEEEAKAAAKLNQERIRREWELEAEAREREHEREDRRRQREWRHKPTVTYKTARLFARRLMRESDYSIWEVRCKGGRIDRTHWRCTVHIFYHCLRGRIRVTGIGIKDHEHWFRATSGELHPCRI